MPHRKPTHRWYHFTPDRLFLGLLVVQVFLLLSEQFRWFPFNEERGWTVLIAVGVVGLAVSVMLLWGLACLCIRRQFQFSFRSLLVFLAAVSVPLSWFAWELQRARKQREAVGRVLGAGGSVTYDFQIGGDGQRITRGQPKTPVWLRKVLGDDFFCEMRVLDCRIGSRRIGDDDARRWEGMTQLTHLYLNGTKITDDGLVHLKRMTELKYLWLERTRITDAGLAHVEGLTSLQDLRLDRTQITDAGVEHLAALTQLRHLGLVDTQVTDKALQHLTVMTNLKGVGIYGTDVTDEGVARLREALPGIWVGHSKKFAAVDPLQPNHPAEVEGAPTAMTPPPMTAGGTENGVASLVMLDVEISNLPMTIQVPKGAAADEHWLVPRIVSGDLFDLIIDVGYCDPGLEELRNSRPDHVAEWNVLVDDEDAVLVQEGTGLRTSYRFAARSTVGMVDYHFRAAPRGDFQPTYRRDDYMLMLRCARTLRRKHPLPNDPAAVFEELGANVKRDSDGNVTGVGLPDFGPCAVTDSTLVLLKKLTHLQRLDLRGPMITNRGAAHLAGLAGLERVMLCETNVTDEGLKHLAECKQLRSVTVRRAKINGVGFAHLQRLEHLTTVNMVDNGVTDEGLAAIAQLPNLTELSLGAAPGASCLAKITDAGWAHFKGHGKLRGLRANQVRLGDSGLACLAGLSELEHLNIADNDISDAGLSHLKGLRQLKTLNLEGNKITDNGLEHLKELSELWLLDLVDTTVTDEAVERLRQVLPDCEIY